ncbi:MAG: hypothetical protein IT340_08140 [Chloroflexi bacterium]|nr:hypothetical protein [Chloroflexota bacterium]
MPSAGQPASSLTGLFEATWRPRKSVTVLWRRVDTISPEAFAAVAAWARLAVDSVPLPWLDAMATNEAAIEAAPAVAELDRLLQLAPPSAVADTIETLRDLIWEASDSNSDWLAWRPCRVCGRRWATLPLEGVSLCPRHYAPAVLLPLLREEMATYSGFVDHTATLERLARTRAPLTTADLALAGPPITNGARGGLSPVHGSTPPADTVAEPLAGDSTEPTAVSH